MKALAYVTQYLMKKYHHFNSDSVTVIVYLRLGMSKFWNKHVSEMERSVDRMYHEMESYVILRSTVRE